MYYHASPVPGIQILEPRISNHNVPLVYFSKKRENVLVYLSSAIERFCNETGFAHAGKWTKWGPYGFQNGIQHIEEYYPNALQETYAGASGYIYYAGSIQEADTELAIPDAAVSSIPVPVDGVEFVPDAYKAIWDAERQGLLLVTRYERLSGKRLDWIRKTMQEEYASAENQPEYRYFLKSKFDFLS